jgi:hypothetical protein
MRQAERFEMPSSPQFFLPAAIPEEQESVYAQMAAICHCSVPSVARRIYSITYAHDGQQWTATVGQPLRGIRRRNVRSKGKSVARDQVVSDPSVVLAIFPGVPYMVFTTHHEASAWANPFMAGNPKSITYFDQA